ncbi:MAG: hypothetical protein RR769_02580, partial [Anaerovoracaceae bacterium]
RQAESCNNLKKSRFCYNSQSPSRAELPSAQQGRTPSAQNGKAASRQAENCNIKNKKFAYLVLT